MACTCSKERRCAPVKPSRFCPSPFLVANAVVTLMPRQGIWTSVRFDLTIELVVKTYQCSEDNIIVSCDLREDIFCHSPCEDSKKSSGSKEPCHHIDSRTEIITRSRILGQHESSDPM